MTSPRTLVLALCLAGAAQAQLQEGDVILNTNTGLRVHRPDGTFVLTTTGSGTDYWGASFTPSGRLVSTFRSPTRGVSLFDATGAEVFSFPTPEVAASTDVSVFSDGTIVVCDNTGGELELYSSQGVHLETIDLPGSGRPFGSVVDADDELWVTDGVLRQIRHYSREGVELGSFSTGACPSGDVDVAEDGSLWTILTDVGAVRNYTRTGGIMSSFSTGWFSAAIGCAVDMDSNLWVSRSSELAVRRYSPAGVILSTVTVPPGQTPRFIAIFEPGLATSYCSPGVANSTGLPGRIEAEGSPFVVDNALTLTALDLPPGEFGYFLVGENQGAFSPPGSAGVLCLVCGYGGCSGIGRFNQAGRIVQGPTGSITVDLTSLPLFPPVAVMPGETWNFQCWYRDLGTSNFTDAISIVFQ